jgi:predicted DNA binding CopG/RHH family protein
MDYLVEELELLDVIQSGNIQSVPFDNDKIKLMAKETRQYNQEKKQISINLKRADLDMVKQRADNIGISYQNIIQALVHNYTTNKISLNI